MAQGAATFVAGTGCQNSEIHRDQQPLPKGSAPPRCGGTHSANTLEARFWPGDAADADCCIENPIYALIVGQHEQANASKTHPIAIGALLRSGSKSRIRSSDGHVVVIDEHLDVESFAHRETRGFRVIAFRLAPSDPSSATALPGFALGTPLQNADRDLGQLPWSLGISGTAELYDIAPESFGVPGRRDHTHRPLMQRNHLFGAGAGPQLGGDLRIYLGSRAANIANPARAQTSSVSLAPATSTPTAVQPKRAPETPLREESL